jgi:hypothetical protein
MMTVMMAAMMMTVMMAMMIKNPCAGVGDEIL